MEQGGVACACGQGPVVAMGEHGPVCDRCLDDERRRGDMAVVRDADDVDYDAHEERRVA